jgi:signal transduction histidine kinase
MKKNKFLSRVTRNDNIAFAVVILAAYVVYFTNSGIRRNLEDNLLIVGLGLIYYAIGIFGSALLEQYRNPLILVGFFTIQIPLGFSIIYIGESLPWLVLLPMVGTAIEFLPRPYAYFICVVLFFAQLLPFYLLFGWEISVAWAMPILAAIVFVAVFTQMTVSEQKARAELAQAHQKLREYAAQVEELAIVEERNRLAREIHDGLGHYLTAVNIQIKASLAMSEQDPSLAREALSKAQTLTQEALTDVRRSISSLREDPTNGRPLTETINQLLDDVRSTGVIVQFNLRGDPRSLNSQVEFTVFRVVQEGLTNIRKHAQASKIQLSLEYLDHSIRLCISDNGTGASQTETGFGLMGLRERVELLGGSLKVDTAPGMGFTLQAEIPV